MPPGTLSTGPRSARRRHSFCARSVNKPINKQGTTSWQSSTIYARPLQRAIRNLYYSILAGAGDPYRRLALDVVNPIGFEGAAARDYANSVGAAIGVTLSGAQWFDLSIALMQQDLDAREGKYADTGSALNLSVKIIRNYHANIFGLFSLPPEAWTAEIPLRMSGYSEATWQLMLVDGGGFVGSLLKGGIIFSIVAAPFAAESQTLPQIQDAATAQAYEGEMGLASFWMHHLFTSRAWIGSAPDIQPFIKQFPDGVVIGGSSNGNEIDGGSGHDLIFGYGGQDTLNGGAGDDVVYGGAGNDTLFSSRGNDVLHGGADYRKTGSSWTEDGIDTADYSTSESGITIYLSDGDQAAKDRGEIYVRNDGFGGTDRLLSIEKILGSSKGDVIFGRPARNAEFPAHDRRRRRERSPDPGRAPYYWGAPAGSFAGRQRFGDA